ncbi:MAG: LolA-like putative outer membrane lipoprotein chaperone [Bacteroidales bacterium]|nr:LolA-like putative outer membrane lipoprotein chaperone [Bacteroidales bacterium]
MRYLYIFFLILLPSVVFSQGSQKANNYLEKSAAIFENNSGITTNFTYLEKDAKSKTNYTFNGELKNKGNKFYLSSPDLKSWFNGKTMWSLMPATEEINISEPSSEEIESINPLSLLRLYKNGYKSHLKKDNSDQSEITLIPDNKDAQWQELSVILNKSTNLPIKIELKDKKDKTIVISFKEIKQSANLKDSDFEFNKSDYPEFEIIDLR